MRDEYEVREFVDDDRQGYVLQIVRSIDGDFWLSIEPDHSYWKERPRTLNIRPSGSVRIRMPMIGGGSHERLYHALASLWRKEPSVELTADECQWLFKRNINWKDGPFGLREKLVGLNRERRPNPRVPGITNDKRGGTLDEFLSVLGAFIRRGELPEWPWQEAVEKFVEKFRKHQRHPFDAVDDDEAVERAPDTPQGELVRVADMQGPIKGRSATLEIADDTTIDHRFSHTAGGLDEPPEDVQGERNG